MSTTPDFSYKALNERFGNGIDATGFEDFPKSVLDKWVEKQPQQPALHWVSHDLKTEKILTYKQLSDLSHRAAVAFSKTGIKKGSRVMVQLPRVNE